MSTAEEPYLRERTLPQPGRRRAQQIVATATLALALIAAAAVALIDSMSGGDAQLLLVVVPSRHILGVATILAFVALSSMFWTLSLPSGWSAMVVIGRVLSIGGALIAVFWGVLTTPWPVTPLLIDGCESGYVVEERSFLFLSSITVLERHGLIATPVLGTSADDGYQPFAAGEYNAWVDDGHIEGWFAMEPGSNPALSRFDLPLSQSPHCG